MSFSYPPARELGELLQKMLGRPVVAKESDGAVDQGATAVFVDGSGTPVAYIAFTAPLAGAAAAALALMPAGAVKTGVRGTRLEPMLAECYFEVANILGQIFNVGDRPHAVLSEVQYGETPDPIHGDDIAVFQVDIAGYGKGTVALAAL